MGSGWPRVGLLRGWVCRPLVGPCAALYGLVWLYVGVCVLRVGFVLWLTGDSCGCGRVGVRCGLVLLVFIGLFFLFVWGVFLVVVVSYFYCVGDLFFLCSVVDTIYDTTLVGGGQIRVL